MASRDQRRGTAALELAIVLPFLLLLFFIAVDYSRVYFYAQTVQNCAFTGAMYASGTARRLEGVTALDAARQAAVAEGASLKPPLTADQVTVTFSGNTVSVNVAYTFRPVSDYPGLPAQVELSKTVTLPQSP